jgi:hypothetical protein
MRASEDPTFMVFPRLAADILTDHMLFQSVDVVCLWWKMLDSCFSRWSWASTWHFGATFWLRPTSHPWVVDAAMIS